VQESWVCTGIKFAKIFYPHSQITEEYFVNLTDNVYCTTPRISHHFNKKNLTAVFALNLQV
jgi:hypothetical protein